MSDFSDLCLETKFVEQLQFDTNVAQSHTWDTNGNNVIIVVADDLAPAWHQGPVSISEKTSFRKIS